MKPRLKKACMQRLHDTFGLTGFRPGQAEAVQALLRERDTMCILPTGAGKSLCWQLPAVMHGGLTVVVSPLIALMRDQVQHLTARGIAAVSLDSLLDAEERFLAMQQLRNGTVQVVFVSPERLMQDSFRRLCSEVPPWMIVVDEAHCVLQWGESFRPAYGEIGGFIASLPKRPVLCALTATADSAMQRAIHESLGMHKAKRILLPVIRENLTYQVRTTLNAAGEILRLMQQEPCKTVVFCRTRIRTEQLASVLAAHGLRGDCYHAGLSREERMTAQQRFTDGTTQILCATTAFGMGVDVPDIRRIIHEDIPDSITDYAQQTGRAGRDGAEAQCILLIEPQRIVRRGYLHSLHGNFIQRWLRKVRKQNDLRKVLKLVLTSPCIPAGLAAGFGQRPVRCRRCSACLHGALLPHAPDLAGMKEWQARAFFLRWQRDALAKQNGCSAEQVLPDAFLHTAAKSLAFPPDAKAPPEMERLLAHFRHGMMHES